MDNFETGQRILEAHLWTPGYEPIKGIGTEKEKQRDHVCPGLRISKTDLTAVTK